MFALVSNCVFAFCAEASEDEPRPTSFSRPIDLSFALTTSISFLILFYKFEIPYRSNTQHWFCFCWKFLTNFVSIINNRNVTRRLASGASEVMSKVSHWRSRPWEAVLYRRLHFLDPWLGPRGPAPKGPWGRLIFIPLNPYNMGVYGLPWTQLGHRYRYHSIAVLFRYFSVLNGTFCTYFGTLRAL